MLMVAKENDFYEIDKESFTNIIKTCLSDFIGCKIDKEEIINTLSKIIPYPYLMEYFSFKVVKGISTSSSDCKGLIYYGDMYVSVDLQELKNGNYIEYLLLHI